MIIFLFQHRFWPAVERLEKLTTIRRPRKRMPKVGDQASLRGWTGRPRWSKQRVLLEPVTLVEVSPIYIDIGKVRLDGSAALWCGLRERLALEDGFNSFSEMQQWFEETHGLPFCGVLFRWTI